jgi:hypothetical protein
VDYFRTHDDGVHAYLRHPCTVQALRKSSKSKGVMVDIDQDDSEVAGGHHDSNSEHKLTTSQLKGGLYSIAPFLSCLINVICVSCGQAVSLTG